MLRKQPKSSPRERRAVVLNVWVDQRTSGRLGIQTEDATVDRKTQKRAAAEAPAVKVCLSGRKHVEYEVYFLTEATFRCNVWTR